MRLRIVAVLLGVLAALFGVGILYTESLRGFPDGHLTAFDRFVHGPRTAVGIADGILALFIWYTALRAPPSKLLRRLLVAAVALSVLLGMELYGFTILRDVLGLEHGQGG